MTTWRTAGPHAVEPAELIIAPLGAACPRVTIAQAPHAVRIVAPRHLAFDAHGYTQAPGSSSFLGVAESQVGFPKLSRDLKSHHELF